MAKDEKTSSKKSKRARMFSRNRIVAALVVILFILPGLFFGGVFTLFGSIDLYRDQQVSQNFKDAVVARVDRGLKSNGYMGEIENIEQSVNVISETWMTPHRLLTTNLTYYEIVDGQKLSHDLSYTIDRNFGWKNFFTGPFKIKLDPAYNKIETKGKTPDFKWIFIDDYALFALMWVVITGFLIVPALAAILFIFKKLDSKASTHGDNFIATSFKNFAIVLLSILVIISFVHSNVSASGIVFLIPFIFPIALHFNSWFAIKFFKIKDNKKIYKLTSSQYLLGLLLCCILLTMHVSGDINLLYFLGTVISYFVFTLLFFSPILLSALFVDDFWFKHSNKKISNKENA